MQSRQTRGTFLLGAASKVDFGVFMERAGGYLMVAIFVKYLVDFVLTKYN